MNWLIFFMAVFGVAIIGFFWSAQFSMAQGHGVVDPRTYANTFLWAAGSLAVLLLVLAWFERRK
jgi:hypothetical protein